MSVSRWRLNHETDTIVIDCPFRATQSQIGIARLPLAYSKQPAYRFILRSENNHTRMYMISTELALICFAWMLNIGSPGPATLSIAGCAMAHGRLRALWLSLGILVGGAGWDIAAAVGRGALMLANAWLFEIVRYLGALYLLYLAFKSLRSAFSAKALIIQSSKNAQRKHLFYRGLLINLSNPKAILGWGSIYALMVPPSSPAWEIAYVFGTLFSCSTLIFVGYALLFSNPVVVNVYQNLRRGFELTFSLFFGFASFKLLTTKLSN